MYNDAAAAAAAVCQSLVLTFVRFKLESHPNCASDFLQIHDGYNPTARRIGRYCGPTLPNNGASINTTHYVATLFFHADASVSRDGFALNWVSVAPSQTPFTVFISPSLVYVSQWRSKALGGNGSTVAWGASVPLGRPPRAKTGSPKC